MRIRLLGPVTGSVDDRPVSLGPRKQRFLLAVLALEVNHFVPVSRLIDLMWPDGPPASARAMVHTYVSGLRAVFDGHRAGDGDPELIGEPSGYQLRADRAAVDAHVFRDLVARARATRSAEQEAALLGEALALWRGPALAGVTTDPIRLRLCGHLEEARLLAAEDRADALLRLGRHRQLVDELLSLVDAHPQRQRLVAALMLGLHRGGRTGEALGVYDRARRALADELGLDPGDDLRGLHRAILRDDPTLGTPAPPSPAAVERGPTPGADRPVGDAPDRRGGPGRPRQLPADLATFTGRRPELARLTAGWPGDASGPPSTPRLVVVEGMAGIGKTALAVHAAHRLSPHFPDGQLFVDLHGFTPGGLPMAPGDALDRMLRALGVPGAMVPEELDDRAALWRTTLAGRRVLLLLDNVADERQLIPLLPGTPGCLTIVTSRIQLPGLDDAEPVPLDPFAPDEAAALLARVSGSAAPTAELAEITRLCGHLPLAIAIAGARLRGRAGWTPGSLTARLRDHQQRLGELDAGSRSVTAAIEMSYLQLDDDRRRMFRLLGLHMGPDIDALAAAALADAAPHAAHRLLAGLLEANLLRQPRPERYEMHDLVRAYAAQLAGRIESTDERAAAPRRLLEHYRYAAWLACEELYPHERFRRPRQIRPSTAVPDVHDPARATALLDAELPNLLAAARWALDNGWPAYPISVAAVLQRHLVVRGLFADAERLNGLALDAAVESGDRAAEARALNDLGLNDFNRGRYRSADELMHKALVVESEVEGPYVGPRAVGGLGLVDLHLGRWDDAQAHLEAALALYRAAGDHSGVTSALINLGIVGGQTGRWSLAERSFREALEQARATGNRSAVAHILTNLGLLLIEADRPLDALDHLREALQAHRETGGTRGEANALGNIGLVLARTGDWAGALARHEEALDLFRRTGARGGETECLNDLGRVLHALNRTTEAAARHHEALTIAEESGDRYQQALALDGLGLADVLRGDDDAARARWGAALDIFAELGVPEAVAVRGRLADLDPTAAR
ncbi:BTAD domain-containing putative transcriptional regulator [Asanoa sp. WMMD1127]|uniref:AfsR/SARP family transcriptional regulator n=1 Tax=Asanoa sp. WMMD1127 TaxID=3016107 RepID=UPI002416DC01|nr:BTAD domain-containing putative transcriptional regulator [Asanoa sp. WMMD1127]MDG4822942.1 BTAD domain-containing putative transcriptional regulator [Asanoa sp. WMMD1127]